LARGKLLHDQNPPLLSDQDFADLKTAADVARSIYEVELLGTRALLAEAFCRRADLAVARKILEDATVLVPHAVKHITRPSSPTTQPAENSWAVTARMVSIGEYVKEGTPLFKLVDDDPIRLRANVPERFVPEIMQGQTVFVTIEGYDRPFEGEVRRINAQIDSASRTFQVEVRISNADRRLKPGAFAKASIQTHIDREVIYVPAAAVQSFAGVTRVYLVKDGKAVEQSVDPAPPGSGRRGWIEIRKGLSATDQVVVEGRNKLAAGTPVNVTGRKEPTTRNAH
ncbi:MAG: efflux RND transporter periplasmic adaptor subunit, partial [Tepidisphaeraceae bacterium]